MGKFGTAIEMSVVNPITKKYMDRGLPYEEDRAITEAEEVKHNKYLDAGMDPFRYKFEPLIWESYGGWSNQSINLIKRFSKFIHSRQGQDKDTSSRHARQHISVLIMRGNAATFINRFPEEVDATLTGAL